MNWDAIGAIGEILGALAVFISLGYLATQIRQSNRQARTDSLRDATKGWTDQHQSAFDTEEKVAFMRRALSSYSSLSADEKGRLFSTLIGYIAAFDSLYNQHQAGLLQENTFRTLESAFIALVRCPGVTDCLIHEDVEALYPD